jgi:hypothetical protein
VRSYNLSKKGKDRPVYPGRKQLLWDGEKMEITNYPAANRFVRREYRGDWPFAL